MKSNTMIKAKVIILSVIALFFLFVPFYSAFISGVFSWHVSQPALWNDAVELLLYVATAFILSVLAKRKKGIVILAVGVVYLLSTGTFSQCLVSYAYIEIVICIGRSFLTLLTKERKSDGVSFLAGTIVYGVPAIIMSLLKHGTIEDLRILVVVLLFVAVINPKYELSMNDLLIYKYVKYMNRVEGAELWFNMFFFTVMLISCARVNTFIEYDSAWYALHVDKCLFGENSFYDYLGYSDFVYYYPKFKELLMAPVSGLGLAGYLISSNLWIMIICMLEIYEFLAEKIKENRNQILAVVYLIFSTACIVGISSTAKSDTLSYLYIIMLILYFVRFLEKKDWDLFWISMTAGIMSYTVKYTSFLYSTIILCIMLITVLHLLFSKKLKLENSMLGVVLMVSACFIFCGILWRTLKLTGYPTYREGIGVWNAIGFLPKPYFAANPDIKPEGARAFDRIITSLFDVGNAGKISAQWWGNYCLFFWICNCFLYTGKTKVRNRFCSVITFLFVGITFYFLVTMPAPDGNHFGIPIIVVMCYLLKRMTASIHWGNNKTWFTIITGSFLLLNLIFVFVTHPSWGTATRFSDDEVSLYVSEEEKLQDKYDYMRSMGIYEINESLSDTDGKLFILSDGPSSMNILNGRIETALFNDYLSGANIDSFEAFMDYIAYVDVNGFIVCKDGSGNEEFGEYVTAYLDQYGCIEQVDTGVYIYYRIR